MRKIFNLLIVCLMLSLCIGLASCMSLKNGAADSMGYADGDYESPEGYSGGGYVPSEISDKTSEYGGKTDGGAGETLGAGKTPGAGEGNGNAPRAGQLTACALFDSSYYDYWQGLQTSNQNGDGIFQGFAEKFAFVTSKRVVVKLDSKIDAAVELLAGEKTVFKARTLKDGTANLFYGKEEVSAVRVTYKDSTSGEEKQEVVDYDPSTGEEVNITLNQAETVNNTIELMFVVDTTGSMGDEIRYLKSEIDNVISAVKNDHPEATILLALLFYRDVKDEYVTRYFDFTEDIDAQKKNLSEQYANGGGDFEEAVEIALAEAVSKQWTTGASTKLIVHVADAPSHDNDVVKWNDAVRTAASKGIRIISVASSGISKKTEYFFRSQSLITSGCYVYLTDDSGISAGQHLEATVKERPTVEYLNSCLIRLIDGYYTGTFVEAVYYGQDIQ